MEADKNILKENKENLENFAFIDINGTKNGGWNQTIRKRGGEDYIPPSNDWIGIGLKVLDKYEDNIWLGSSNEPGEWCVAYHGTSLSNAKNIIKLRNDSFNNRFTTGIFSINPPKNPKANIVNIGRIFNIVLPLLKH